MLRFSSPTAKIAFYAACMSIPITFNETSGYLAFNFEDGWNPICEIDPTCRKLTEEEIELAKEYYGDSIDYTQVNYFNRPPMWGLKQKQDALAVSLFGNIYENDSDFFEAPYNYDRDNLFLHEMMHVWQYQQGHIHPYDRNRREHDEIYGFSISDFENFLDYGIEQQGSIIQVVHQLRNAVDYAIEQNSVSAATIYCEALNRFENLIAQEIPIPVTDCSNLEAEIAPEF